MTNQRRPLDVLALNSGSSSLKFAWYRVDAGDISLMCSGEAESIGEQSSQFKAIDSEAQVICVETVAISSQQLAIEKIENFLSGRGLSKPGAVGHRIVHGGPRLRQHCVINDSILEQLEAATPFAPLHMPSALSLIRLAQVHFASSTQVACFDTAFHAAMPDIARTLPIRKALQRDGIQRYGFHGLSCQSIVSQLTGDGSNQLPQRLIIAHLGNGASITAVKDGKSIDTSMGLTPTGGVIMGTRSGDIDPGLMIYLIREKKFDADHLEDLFDHHSGLSGVSGIGGDLRTLHQAAATNANAQLAIKMFCYSVRKQIAAMITTMDGVDMIVFTGGIGENDVAVRADICEGLSWIGIRLHQERNHSAVNPISDPESRCAVQVLEAREDEQIACETEKLVRSLSINSTH